MQALHVSFFVNDIGRAFGDSTQGIPCYWYEVDDGAGLLCLDLLAMILKRSRCDE